MRPIATLCLLLAACNSGPEVPSEAENRDLDEAAQLLDNADDNLATVDAGNLDVSSTEPQM